MPRTRHRFGSEPIEGEFPHLTYTYDPESKSHRLVCSCRNFDTATTDEGIARYAAAQHSATHARHRITTPEEEIEP